MLALGWLTVEFFYIVLKGDQLHFLTSIPKTPFCLLPFKTYSDAAQTSLLAMHPCIHTDLPADLCPFCAPRSLSLLWLFRPFLFPSNLLSLPPQSDLASLLLGRYSFQSLSPLVSITLVSVYSSLILPPHQDCELHKDSGQGSLCLVSWRSMFSPDRKTPPCRHMQHI